VSASTSTVSPNNNTITNNSFGSSTILPTIPGDNNIISNNRGYTTESSGSATVPSDYSSIAVVHNLAATPTKIQLTPTSSTEGIAYYVPEELKGSTTFTITMASAPTTNVSFDWSAEV